MKLGIFTDAVDGASHFVEVADPNLLAAAVRALQASPPPAALLVNGGRTLVASERVISTLPDVGPAPSTSLPARVAQDANLGIQLAGMLAPHAAPNAIETSAEVLARILGELGQLRSAATNAKVSPPAAATAVDNSAPVTGAAPQTA